jgi:hypothetical protein
VNGFGPPVISPVARSSCMRSRVASAMPIAASVKARPLGAITAAPASTARCASGMSDVMTTSPAPARSAIQSSVASKPCPTTTRSISGSRGTIMNAFETTKTLTPWRCATR